MPLNNTSFDYSNGGMFDLALLPVGAMGRRILGSNLGVKIHSVTDGTSNTMMLSEVLPVNSIFDSRGAWTWAVMGGEPFSAQFPPNSVGTDLPPVFDNSAYPANSPLWVAQAAGVLASVAAARSNHSGGIIMVGMVDGSVRMVASDTLDLTVWQALATRSGGETVALP